MTRTTRLLALAVTMFALTIALSACGSSSKSSTGSSGAASSTITIHNFTFSPATLTVKAGTTVTVKNTDDTAHTVTALLGAFNTGPIQPGKTATFTVSKAGTDKYHCNIHNYMTGTIQVTG